MVIYYGIPLGIYVTVVSLRGYMSQYYLHGWGDISHSVISLGIYITVLSPWEIHISVISLGNICHSVISNMKHPVAVNFVDSIYHSCENVDKYFTSSIS